jgi:hypothetical protein
MISVNKATCFWPPKIVLLLSVTESTRYPKIGATPSQASIYALLKNRDYYYDNCIFELISKVLNEELQSG